MFVQVICSACIFYIFFQMVIELDKKVWELAADRKIAMLLCGIYLWMAAVGNKSTESSIAIFDAFFWASLALAAFCDYCTKEIYDFVYLPALVSGITKVLLSPEVDVIELVFFIGIQAFVFSRMYGISDCIAFSVCALQMASDGADLLEYVVHMIITMTLMVTVQGFRKNINKKIQFKEEVAMIPYIATAMLILQFMR